jgi:chemotaxis protein methyltransferase CheR
MNLSLDQFRVMRDMVQRSSGLFFKDVKQSLFEKRVDNRCGALKCRTSEEYIARVSSDMEELSRLIEELTTNETYFFRDQEQLAAFIEDAVPRVIAVRQQCNGSVLKIWSAACSTGEEPYSLAMLLQERYPGVKYEIVATDIHRGALDTARRGLYEGRSLKDVSPKMLARFFTPVQDGFEVNHDVRKTVDFRQLNLLDEQRMRLMWNFDIIFCRNVLIYFTRETIQKITHLLYESLAPGGFMFLGQAESMHLLGGALKVVHFNRGLGYMKE